MKMRFFDFKRLFFSVFSILLMAVYVVFLGSCVNPNTPVYGDEENEGQGGYSLDQGDDGVDSLDQGGYSPFCDDKSKCIVFKPRAGKYSYEKAPVVLELPKNLGKYAFMTGLVTTGKVRSIKIFVDEAILNKGSGEIEEFLSIFSISGTKKESSLLSLSDINERPIPMTRLDFSLDDNDADVTYVRIRDTLDEKYVKEKFEAYKVALEEELDSGAEEEEAIKLQEGLDWLNKGHGEIGDELAEKKKGNLIEKMKRDYLNHATVTGLYAAQGKRKDSKTYRDLLTAVENAKIDGVNDLQANIDRIFEDKNIVDTFTFLKKMTEEIDLVVGEITERLTVLKNGVESMESEYPRLEKTFIEYSIEYSDTYKKTRGFIKDIETMITNGIGGHEAKIKEVDKFISSMSNAGDASSRIDVAIRDEIKQILSNKIAEEDAIVKGLKVAMDKKGLSAEELDTSSSYRSVDGFITGRNNAAVLTEINGISEYITRWASYVKFYDYGDKSVFVSSVYKEILDGRRGDFRGYPLAVHRITGNYSLAEVLKLSPTYSAFNELYKEVHGFRGENNYEEGYNSLSAGMGELRDGGIKTPEEFAAKVIEEIEVGALGDEIKGLLDKLRGWEQEMGANKNTKAEDLELSGTYSKVKKAIEDEEVALADGTEKAVYEGRKKRIEGVIEELRLLSVTNSSSYIKEVYKEILGLLVESLRAEYLGNAGLTKYSDEGRKGSQTYSELNELYKEVDGFRNENNYEEGYNSLSAGMGELRDGGIKTPEEFAAKVIEEIEVGALGDEIKGLLDKLRGWEQEMGANKNTKAEDLELSGTYSKVKKAIEDGSVVIPTGSAKAVYEGRESQIEKVIEELRLLSVTNSSSYIKEVYKEILGVLVESLGEEYLGNAGLTKYSDEGRKGSQTYSAFHELYKEVDGFRNENNYEEGYNSLSAGMGELRDGGIKTPEEFAAKVIEEIEVGALGDEIKGLLDKLRGWEQEMGANKNTKAEDLELSGTYSKVKKAIEDEEVALADGTEKAVYEGRKKRIEGVIEELRLLSVTNSSSYIKEVYKEILGVLVESLGEEYLGNAGLTKYSDEGRKGSQTYSELNELYKEVDGFRNENNYEEGYNSLSAGMGELRDGGIKTPEEFAAKVIEEIEVGALGDEIKGLLDKLRGWEQEMGANKNTKAEDLELSGTYSKVKKAIEDGSVVIPTGSAKAVYEGRESQIEKVIEELRLLSVTNSSSYIKEVYKEILGLLVESLGEEYLGNAGLTKYSDEGRKGSQTYSAFHELYKEVDGFRNENNYEEGYNSLSAGMGELRDGGIKTPEEFAAKVIEEIEVGALGDEIKGLLDKLRGWEQEMGANKNTKAEDLELSGTYSKVKKAIEDGSVVIPTGSAKAVYEGRESQIEKVIEELRLLSVTNSSSYIKEVYKEILGVLVESLGEEYLGNAGLTKYSDEGRKGSQTYSAFHELYKEVDGFRNENNYEEGYNSLSAGMGELRDGGIKTPEEFAAKVIEEIEVGALGDEIKGLLDKLRGWEQEMGANKNTKAEDLELSGTYSKVKKAIEDEEVALADGTEKAVYEGRKKRIEGVIEELRLLSVTNSSSYIKEVYKEILGLLVESLGEEYLGNAGLTKYSDEGRKGSQTYSELNEMSAEVHDFRNENNYEEGYNSLSAGMGELRDGGIKTPEEFAAKVIEEIEVGALGDEIKGLLDKLRGWEQEMGANKNTKAEDLELSGTYSKVKKAIEDGSVVIPTGSAKAVYEGRKKRIEKVIEELRLLSVTNSSSYIKEVYKEILGLLVESLGEEYLGNAGLTKYSDEGRKGSQTYSAFHELYKEVDGFRNENNYEEGYNSLSAGMGELRDGGIKTPEEFAAKVIEEIEVGALGDEIKGLLDKLRGFYFAGKKEKMEDRYLADFYDDVEELIIDEGVALEDGTEKSVYETRKKRLEDFILVLDGKGVTNKAKFVELLYKERLEGLLEVVRAGLIENISVLAVYFSKKRPKLDLHKKARKKSLDYRKGDDAYVAAKVSLSRMEYKKGYIDLKAGVGNNISAILSNMKIEKKLRRKLSNYMKSIKKDFFVAISKAGFNRREENLVSSSYAKLKQGLKEGRAARKEKNYKAGYNTLKALKDGMNIVDSAALIAKMNAEIDVFRQELNGKIAILDAWLKFGVMKIKESRLKDLTPIYKKVKDFRDANLLAKISIKNYKAKINEYDLFIDDQKKVGIIDVDTFSKEVKNQLESNLQSRLAVIKRDYIDIVVIVGKKELSSMYITLNKDYKRATKVLLEKKYGDTDRYIVNIEKTTPAAYELQVNQEIADIELAQIAIDAMLTKLRDWEDAPFSLVDKILYLDLSKSNKLVKALILTEAQLLVGSIKELDYEGRKKRLEATIADLGTKGASTKGEYIDLVFKEILEKMLSTTKRDYIENTGVVAKYKTEAEREMSPTYKVVNTQYKDAETFFGQHNYFEGYKALAVEVYILAANREIFITPDEFETKVVVELVELEQIAIDAMLAKLKDWNGAFKYNIPTDLDLSKSNKLVKALILTEAQLLVGSIKELDYEGRKKRLEATIADLGTKGASTKGEYIDLVFKEILEKMLSTTKRDYIENTGVVAKYKTEAEREMSLTYKGINTGYKDAKILFGQEEYEDGYNLMENNKVGTLSPEEFAAKVNEEIEAAKRAGAKDITKREGVLDYIVSGFHSFIDRLIESRDKIKNTEREIVKVFQGNVEGVDDLELDLEVLKEKATWSNFYRFKGFVEAGGFAYLRNVAVDFRYTAKDAGLKDGGELGLSCENSSFFMTKEELVLKAKSRDRGINLGDFGTTDRYNCDLSSVVSAEVNPEVKRSKRAIRFRVKGVNIAAGDEHKVTDLGELDAFMRDGFLFSEKVQKGILASSMVKQMPVIDVEIVVLDTVSFNEKCRKTSCNVAP